MMSLRLGTTAMLEARRSGVRHGRSGNRRRRAKPSTIEFGGSCPLRDFNGTLHDHLVGNVANVEDVRRNSENERLGGVEVDDQRLAAERRGRRDWRP